MKYFRLMFDVTEANGCQYYVAAAESKDAITIDDHVLEFEELEVQGMSDDPEITEITEEEYLAAVKEEDKCNTSYADAIAEAIVLAKHDKLMIKAVSDSVGEDPEDSIPWQRADDFIKKWE